MAIQILLAPSTPAAPARETPPEPARAKPQIEPKVETQNTPPIAETPNVKADVAIPPKEVPAPAKPAPPPPPVVPAAPATAAAAPVRGTPTTGVTSVQQNYDASIVARIERKKRYPGEAIRQRLEDVIYVRIVIDRGGHVVASDIIRSHHFALLDDSVRQLVRSVDPLPKIPKELDGDTYSVVVPIDFFIGRDH